MGKGLPSTSIPKAMLLTLGSNSAVRLRWLRTSDLGVRCKTTRSLSRKVFACPSPLPAPSHCRVECIRHKGKFSQSGAAV